jgi:hypothetical protein
MRKAQYFIDCLRLSFGMLAKSRRSSLAAISDTLGAALHRIDFRPNYGASRPPMIT